MTEKTRTTLRWSISAVAALMAGGLAFFFLGGAGEACAQRASAQETSAQETPEPVQMAAVTGEWPQFRGPNRDGVSSQKGLLESWPKKGPQELWRVDVGSGFSGISVSGGRAFTMFNRDGGEWLVAFDAASGKELWQLRTDSAFTNSFGDGPRSTPTVDGSTVFAFGANAKLFAADVATGEVRWQRDLVKDFGARIPTWGVATAPLVEGDLLLLDVGGRAGASLLAFNKGSGEEVWSVGDDLAGYSAPIAFTVGETRQVVFFTGRNVTAISPADGRVLWSEAWKTDYDINAAAPIFIAPNRLFISSGYDVGAALFELSSVEGVWKASEVWRGRNMKNQFSSSVRVGEVLFGFDDSTLKAIDLATGKDLWRHRGLGHGSLIYADGSLIVLGDKGDLVLVEASGKAYEEKAAVQIFDGKCWTTPALVDGRLFLRDEKEMISLRVAS